MRAHHGQQHAQYENTKGHDHGAEELKQKALNLQDLEVDEHCEPIAEHAFTHQESCPWHLNFSTPVYFKSLVPQTCQCRCQTPPQSAAMLQWHIK
jgi:hypothetical protein